MSKQLESPSLTKMATTGGGGERALAAVAAFAIAVVGIGRGLRRHSRTLSHHDGITLALDSSTSAGANRDTQPMATHDSTRSYWVTWHDAYDDPESDLSQRLIAVQHRLSNAIDQAPPGAIRVISACAGQGHDVIGVLKSHPRKSEVHALLVESDDDNVRVTRARIARASPVSMFVKPTRGTRAPTATRYPRTC
jgi:hypothetical protein